VYSEAVEQLQAEEKATGIATQKSTEYLEYRNSTKVTEE
jgi:hypothetical protein